MRPRARPSGRRWSTWSTPARASGGSDRARRRRGIPDVGLNVVFLPDGRDLIVEQILDAPAAGPRLAAPPVRRRRPGAAEGRRCAWARRPRSACHDHADRRRLFVTSPQDGRDHHDRRRPAARVQRWPAGDVVGRVSPDGSAVRARLATGAVRAARPALRTCPALRRGSHAGVCSTLAFTPDGRTLVTSGADGTLIVWDVARGEIRERLSRPRRRGRVGTATSPPTGAPSTARGHDERAFAWDLAGDRRLDPAVRRRPAVRPSTTATGPRAASRSARTAAPLAVTQTDGTVDLLDAQTLRPRRSLRCAARLRRRGRLQPRRAPARRDRPARADR